MNENYRLAMQGSIMIDRFYSYKYDGLGNITLIDNMTCRTQFLQGDDARQFERIAIRHIEQGKDPLFIKPLLDEMMGDNHEN